MRDSRRFINFASITLVGLLFATLCACKGRTADNMTPDGDTIEVVIQQPVENEN